MKKLLSSFLLILCGLLFAQEYRPMLHPNNVWESYQIEEGEMGYSTDYQHKMSESTLLFNDKEYTRFIVRSRPDNFPPAAWSDWSNSFYLHENIEDKKVYIYYPSNEGGAEYLLYDFDLNVGDEVPLQGMSNYDNPEDPIIITSIDYQTVFGISNVKTYHTNYNYEQPLKIYEGIGGSSGVNFYNTFNVLSTLENFTNQPDDYTPLIQNQNGWEFSSFVWEFGLGEMHYTDFQMKYSGETMNYNAKTYHAVQLRNRTRIENTPTSDWNSWVTKFYLAEDIDNKKVHIYYPDNSTFGHSAGEFLLYNFDLDVDHNLNLDGFAYSEGIPFAQVRDITYENIQGLTNVKTFHMIAQDEFEFEIYEGIGSSFGPITMSFMYDAGWELNFYGILSNKEFNLASTKVYPNPFTNQIQIDSAKNIKQLQIFDLTGKLIQSKTSLNELNAQLPGLNSGVYILTITYQNNTKESVKLMKK